MPVFVGMGDIGVNMPMLVDKIRLYQNVFPVQYVAGCALNQYLMILAQYITDVRRNMWNFQIVSGDHRCFAFFR